MRQVFLSLFTLLFCLISSCTKENVSNFDDKLIKKWVVTNSTISFSGVDTLQQTVWKPSDTTFMRMEFDRTSVATIIFDPLLNFKEGKADTLKFLWTKFDDDLIKIGLDTYHIKHLTPSGMQLEYLNTFFDTPPYDTEKREISLVPL